MRRVRRCGAIRVRASVAMSVAETDTAVARVAVARCVLVWANTGSVVVHSDVHDKGGRLSFPHKTSKRRDWLKEVEAEEIDGMYAAAIEQFRCRYEDILAVGPYVTVDEYLKNTSTEANI